MPLRPDTGNINKRKIGNYYEDKAVLFLKQNGYSILCRNYVTKHGEIDIIAKNNNELCFIEVKYRSSDSYGMPSEAVDIRKQNKIIRTAEQFLARNDERIISIYGQSPYISFDIVEIISDRIRILKDSFQK